MTALVRQLDTLAEHSDVYKDSQRLAIIDMGSNSFRMIVVEYVPKLSFRVVDEVAENVRLSEGMGDENILRAAAMGRASRVVQIYAAFCKATGIQDIIAVGTSAIRDAKNQIPFLTRLQAESGIRVRVLSADEEAYYGYLAAVNSTQLENGFALDMGGGSLQISRVEGRKLRQSISFPLGAVRVTEQFLKSDPVTEKQLTALRSYLETTFQKLDWFHYEPGMMMVFEGGGVRMLGRLAQRMDHYPLELMHGYVMNGGQVKAIRKLLADKTIQERKRIPGLKAERADIALGSATVVYELMRSSGFDELMISGQGVRGGLFYERFLMEAGEPIFDNVRAAAVLNLAHIYRFQEKHAEHIVNLTLSMFDQLPEGCHNCTKKEREILWAAAMLHDIGVAVDYSDHHQHSAYLILNAGLPGYTHREIALIALLTRYHRKGQPTTDELAPLLQAEDERRLIQLCALLRLAEQIDRSRDGVAQSVRLTTGSGWAQLELLVRGDGQVALWSVERHEDIFEQAFGLKLEVTLSVLS